VIFALFLKPSTTRVRVQGSANAPRPAASAHNSSGSAGSRHADSTHSPEAGWNTGRLRHGRSGLKEHLLLVLARARAGYRERFRFESSEADGGPFAPRAAPRTLIRQSGNGSPPEASGFPTKTFDQHEFRIIHVRLCVHCGAFVRGDAYVAGESTSECGDCCVRTAPVF
jgi:hypothetical protein